MAVGLRVRELRIQKGLTMADLAPAALIDEKHIQLIETAKTNASIASLACLAAALEVPLSELFVKAKSRKS
jgi:transcriptional regulator with XRE-family HTH domain